MALVGPFFFDTSVLLAGLIDLGAAARPAQRVFDAIADGRLSRPPTAVADSLTGGRINDAHIAEIARLAGAETVVTDNRRHFTQLLRHGIRVLSTEEFAAGMD